MTTQLSATNANTFYAGPGIISVYLGTHFMGYLWEEADDTYSYRPCDQNGHVLDETGYPKIEAIDRLVRYATYGEIDA